MNEREIKIIKWDSGGSITEVPFALEQGEYVQQNISETLNVKWESLPEGSISVSVSSANNMSGKSNGEQTYKVEPEHSLCYTLSGGENEKDGTALYVDNGSHIDIFSTSPEATPQE